MRLNLLTQIFIAFIAAIIFGIIFGPAINIVQPLGDLFLRLIKFIVVPLVFTSLIVGVAGSGNIREFGAMGGKTFVYYLVTTAIAVTIGIGVGYLFSPGSGLEMSANLEEVEVSEAPGVVDILLNIVPTNPIESLVTGNMLQIIFFAIFVGLGITMLGDKGKNLFNVFNDMAEVMYKITRMVMVIAPIGVFGLTAPIVGEYGLSVLLPLMKLIIALFVGCILHIVIVYFTAVKVLGKMNPFTFLKGIAPAALVAFTTTSSSGTLPVSFRCCEENLKVPRKVSSFVLPLGATINMDGTALYQGLCVLFIAQVFGVDLTVTQLMTIVLTATLASIGTAGVPGAGLIMLSMVMAATGLPLEGIALIAGVDRILDMMRTSVNVTGDGSAAVIVSTKERQELSLIEKSVS